MKALRLNAGPSALRWIRENGLQPGDIRTIAGAAGGPKGLILGPLDRWLSGQWLPLGGNPVDLVGASIGAWRMATACLNNGICRDNCRLPLHCVCPPFALTCPDT